MTKTRWPLLAAAALSILSLAACNVATKPDNAATTEGSRLAAVDRLARVEMNADTSYLTAEEKQVVNLLNQAADQLNAIYLRQVSADNPRLREEIAARNDPALLDRFDTFMGPWDEVDEDKPFFGSAKRPVGGGFYPADLTKEQFDAYLAAHPAEADALKSPYTVVKRQGEKLIALPTLKENSDTSVVAALLRRHQVTMQVVERVETVHAALALVLAGEGYALVPACAAVGRPPGVAFRRLKGINEGFDVAACRRHDLDSPFVEPFIAAARQALR